MSKIKAVCLFSGGLDSILATKLMLNAGIDVFALKINTPFYERARTGKDRARITAESLGMPLKIIDAGKEYLRIIRNPKHGHGSGMNPCIDCRIYMLKRAKAYADSIGAEFVFTGEVLGQRPMSQRIKAMKFIEKKSGLAGKIVRPLCGKLLAKTDAEKEGWIEREKLMAIRGRSRRMQICLAKELGVHDYPLPGGGCLLTCSEFARKVSDLLFYKKRVFANDLEMLKVGRHFRFGENKIVVGANESDNKQLLYLKNKTDYIFEVPGLGSPTTILKGKKTKDAIRMAARLTLRYSDALAARVVVKYGYMKPVRGICVLPAREGEIKKFRV